MNRIKELRLKKGLTQAEVGKKLGISDRAVGYYENGEREPDNKTLLGFAEIFNVTVDYLLGRTDIKNTNTNNTQDKEFMALYEKYNDLDDADKDVLRATLDAFVRAKKGDK